MHVRLAHLKADAFIERIAKQEAVDKARIDARHAHHAAATHRRDALAQRFAATALDFEIRQHGFRQAAFGLKTDRIDNGVHAAVARRVFNNKCRRIVVFIEVNRDNAVTLFGEGQTIIIMVDHKDLFCAHQPRAGGAEQPHRARAVNRYLGAFLHLTIFHRLPGCRQDIGEKQRFIIRE